MADCAKVIRTNCTDLLPACKRRNYWSWKQCAGHGSWRESVVYGFLVEVEALGGFRAAGFADHRSCRVMANATKTMTAYSVQCETDRDETLNDIAS